MMGNSIESKAIRELQVDKLRIKIYADRQAMGLASAQAMASKLKELLSKKDTVNVVFAAAQSQVDFLASLIKEPGIDW